MKVHILGCGGWIPRKNETSCFLLEHKENLIMLDAGTGTSNLYKYSDVMNKYDSLSVVLTHYHLDHIIGLIYLLPYIEDKTLNIYGPGVQIYEKTTEEYLNEFLQNAFFARPLYKFAKKVNCYDYKGNDFIIDDISLKVTPQKHSSPSYRIQIEDKLVYSTDVIYNANDWTSCDKSKLLLHECWDIIDNGNANHTSLESLLKSLPIDKFDNILLVHQNPNWTQQDMDSINNMLSGTNICLASDKTTFLI